MRLALLKEAIVRHLRMHNFAPYERVLQSISSKGDIWIASQGEYIEWWRKRESANFKIFVSSKGECFIDTDLENAVFEQVPGKLFTDRKFTIENTAFEGELLITVDKSLKRKDLALEILKSEGILNLNEGRGGKIFLSRELDGLLKQIETQLQERKGYRLGDLYQIREMVNSKLSLFGLPLIRVWYHPAIDDRIIKAVFSPRYDVDRAITNVKKIRMLEEKYGANSTFHIRAFGPFYTEREIRKVASQQLGREIALHGEFVTNAKLYGDEFDAATAEKEQLETFVKTKISGASAHGGELVDNASANTAEILEKHNLLYYSPYTSNNEYYLPVRPIIRGRLGDIHVLNTGLMDIQICADSPYQKHFYKAAINKMDQIYKLNGIFVLVMHPIYFGFMSYLLRPANLFRLAAFLPTYLKRLFGSESRKRAPEN